MEPTSAHIYWLNGMAGTGKTTIALSVIRLLLKEHLLGGWFLCTRDGGPAERNAKKILPVLSESLGNVFPAYKDTRDAAFRDRPLLVDTITVEDQLDALFGDALDKAYINSLAPPFVFVVDALDECDDQDATAQLLHAILGRAPNSRVKYFVTSRPERKIRYTLSVNLYPVVLRLHDVEKDVVSADIKLYLWTELRRLAKRTPELNPGSEWPSHYQVDTLTYNADRLFIYASTALKYISAGDPIGRLERLTLAGASVSKFAMSPLDMMYELILSEAHSTLEPDSSECSDFLRCLSALVCATENLAVSSMASLLGISPYRVRVALGAVHSMVFVPLDDNGYVATFHASFADYLTDRMRAGRQDWFVNRTEGHKDLFNVCLNIMASQLHFNFVGAHTSTVLNRDQSLNAVPQDVSYASRMWPDHIMAVSEGYDSDILNRLETVLESKFLYWVEILSLLDHVWATHLKLRSIPREKAGSISMIYVISVA